MKKIFFSKNTKNSGKPPGHLRKLQKTILDKFKNIFMKITTKAIKEIKELASCSEVTRFRNEILNSEELFFSFTDKVGFPLSKP